MTGINIYLPVVVSIKVATSADQPIIFGIPWRGLPTTEASWGSWALSWKSDLAISFDGSFEIRRAPVEVGSLSTIIYDGFCGGWPWDFWTINSYTHLILNTDAESMMIWKRHVLQTFGRFWASILKIHIKSTPLNSDALDIQINMRRYLHPKTHWNHHLSQHLDFEGNTNLNLW